MRPIRSQISSALTEAVSCPATNNSLPVAPFPPPQPIATVSKQCHVTSQLFRCFIFCRISNFHLFQLQRDNCYFWGLFQFQFLAVWIAFLVSDKTQNASQVPFHSTAGWSGPSLSGSIRNETTAAQPHKSPDSLLSLSSETLKVPVSTAIYSSGIALLKYDFIQ